MSCFYADGSLANDWAYTACRDTTASFPYSTCCVPSAGDRCLSKGLCDYTTGGYLYRGACADEHGQGCPSICPESSNKTVNANSWTPVLLCAKDAYCCSSSLINDSTPTDCCADGSARFNLSEPPTRPLAKGPSTGTIAGATVGSVAGAGCLLALCLLTRRRRGRGETQPGDKAGKGEPFEAGGDAKLEVEADSTRRVEMAG
ncbi:hypothetical protein L249_0478 [Ophiocordyceps polyrhachis-furcata BCC 54312]|uniref:Uncharacterized protein n=1 Tax=Ophiocordyceps polyrhachis-furcata BCC 54312 TaxID=1330021 RepID=A0A367LD60_9HYPO|nr:hypothetical protein L249_0478 [Ophiocordyceps polyrhachis-furcata BCC 54312]